MFVTVLRPIQKRFITEESLRRSGDNAQPRISLSTKELAPLKRIARHLWKVECHFEAPYLCVQGRIGTGGL